MIRLYVTPSSPYARITRVAIIDAGLADRTEIIPVQTRTPKTSLFQISPLARVPCLSHNNRLIADTRDICHYIDTLTKTPQWLPPENEAMQTQRHIATGLLDSVAIWLRENARPAGSKSQAVLDFEDHRVNHILAWVEANFDALFKPPSRWDFTTLSLAAALDIAQLRGMESIQTITPGLSKWLTTATQRPSMRQTTPLPV